MANGTPYTEGKNDEGAKKFAGTGGHTSRGVMPAEHGAKSSGGAKTKEVNRIGSLKERTHGVSTSGYGI